MRTTKVYAREVLNLWKDKTGYFNGSMTQLQFESMLQDECGLGLAESITVTMALILAGAKFSG